MGKIIATDLPQTSCFGLISNVCSCQRYPCRTVQIASGITTEKGGSHLVMLTGSTGRNCFHLLMAIGRIALDPGKSSMRSRATAEVCTARRAHVASRKILRSSED